MPKFFTVRVLKHLLRLHMLFNGFFGSQGFSVQAWLSWNSILRAAGLELRGWFSPESWD